MSARTWAGRVLTEARRVFPETIDIAHVEEPRSGRRMGWEMRAEVRKLLVKSGLASFDHPTHQLRAAAPPPGVEREWWIAHTVRDVRVAIRELKQAAEQ